MSTAIYFVRHCPYANPRGIVPFRLPGFPLSQAGKQCAINLAKFFASKQISVIYTSPILRCHQTATIIGQTLKLKSIVSQDIIELNTPFQSMKKLEFDHQGGDTFAHQFHLEGGGETIAQVFTRMNRFVDQILNTHSGHNVISISHGDPIMVLIYGLVDHNPELILKPARPYIPEGGMVKLEFHKDKVPIITTSVL